MIHIGVLLYNAININEQLQDLRMDPLLTEKYMNVVKHSSNNAFNTHVRIQNPTSSFSLLTCKISQSLILKYPQISLLQSICQHWMIDGIMRFAYLLPY